MHKKYAMPKGTHGGKRWHMVPVVVRCNDSQTLESREIHFDLLAPGAKAALDWVADRIRRPETEVHAWGPKGGHYERFQGWNGFIGASLLDEQPEVPEWLDDLLGEAVREGGRS